MIGDASVMFIELKNNTIMCLKIILPYNIDVTKQTNSSFFESVF